MLRARTDTHLMSVGLDEDLDDAPKRAVRESCAGTNPSCNQAYMLCSPIGDLRVTKGADGNKSVYMILARAYR